MAFVHRSPRRTAQPSNATPSSVGPGSYHDTVAEQSNHTHKLKLSYAPFASSAERGIDDRYDAVEYTPGPGEYTGINTLSWSKAPGISTAFVSQVPRFGRDPEPSTAVPGPGSYKGIDVANWIPKRHSHARRKDGAPGNRKGGVEWVKVSVPPSIPAPAQSFGYEENEHGELVLQTPAQLAGLQQPGPGEYLSFAHENIIANERKRGFAEWSRSRTHRAGEIALRRAASQPGPTSYAPPVDAMGQRESRRKGKKISPFFASKVQRLRSADDSSIASRAAVPGPGSYSASSDFDRVATHFVPEQYQFFGSKTSRVVGGILASNNPTPGPGTYTSKSSLKVSDPNTQDPYAVNLAFKSTSRRFAKEANYDVPGPGSYKELTNTSVELSKKIFGRNTSFGTTEARFHKSDPNKSDKVSSDLGPTSYSPTNATSIRTSRKPLSVFVSATKRFDAASGKSVQEEKIDIERANLGYASAMASKPVGIGNEPTYGNRSKIAQHSSSFAARAPRFDDRSVRKSQASGSDLGPGSYSANATNLYRAAPAVSSSFKNTERASAAVGGVYRRDNVPGPGAYTRDVTNAQNSSLIKRSFNITIATDV